MLNSESTRYTLVLGHRGPLEDIGFDYVNNGKEFDNPEPQRDMILFTF